MLELKKIVLAKKYRRKTWNS